MDSDDDHAQDQDQEQHLIESLKDWVEFGDPGMDLREIETRLQDRMSRYGVLESATAWVEILKHAYDKLAPIQEKVNDLFTRFVQLTPSPALDAALREHRIYPQSGGRDVLPPEVPLFDAAIMMREMVYELRPRLLLVMRATAIKKVMRRSLREAVRSIKRAAKTKATPADHERGDVP